MRSPPRCRNSRCAFAACAATRWWRCAKARLASRRTERARVARDLAQSRFEESHRTLGADRRRLDEVKLEERNLIREIAKLGTSDEFYEVLAELREEKAAIQARIEAGQPEWSPASLEKPVRAAISQIESLLQASPEKAYVAWT